MIADNNLGSDGMAGGFHYDAYGRIVRTDNDGAEGDASDYAWFYSHQCIPQDDEASVLHRFRHRERSPLFGRWLQRDPLAHVTGLSLYEYAQPGR